MRRRSQQRVKWRVVCCVIFFCLRRVYAGVVRIDAIDLHARHVFEDDVDLCICLSVLLYIELRLIVNKK